MCVVIDALREQPRTARDLAAVTGEPLNYVSTVVRNLSRQQQIAVVGEAPREGRQPVRVYRYREPQIFVLDGRPPWFR